MTPSREDRTIVEAEGGEGVAVGGVEAVQVEVTVMLENTGNRADCWQEVVRIDARSVSPADLLRGAKRGTK